MAWFFNFLVWLKSKQAAYYMAILVVLMIDAVLAWRVYSVYYDAVYTYTQSIWFTVPMSVVAFVAVLLSSSIISIHPPKNRKVFWLLVFLAVTHDWGGVFFSVFQNTLYADSLQAFFKALLEKPGSTALVAALSCLGLIPLTLSSVIEEWHSGMQAELEEQHQNFLNAAARKAERIVIGKLNKEIEKKDLPALVGIIQNDQLKLFAGVVTGTGYTLPQQSSVSLEENRDEFETEKSQIHLIEEGDDFISDDDRIQGQQLPERLKDDGNNEGKLTTAFDEELNALEDEPNTFDEFGFDDDSLEEEEAPRPLAVTRRKKHPARLVK